MRYSWLYWKRYLDFQVVRTMHLFASSVRSWVASTYLSIVDWAPFPSAEAGRQAGTLLTGILSIYRSSCVCAREGTSVHLSSWATHGGWLTNSRRFSWGCSAVSQVQCLKSLSSPTLANGPADRDSRLSPMQALPVAPRQRVNDFCCPTANLPATKISVQLAAWDWQSPFVRCRSALRSKLLAQLRGLPRFL